MTGFNWLRELFLPGEGALIEALCVFGWTAFAIGPFFLGTYAPLALPWAIALAVVPVVVGRWLLWRFANRSLALTLLTLLVVLCFGAFVKLQVVPWQPLGDARWLEHLVFPWGNNETSSQQNQAMVVWMVGAALIARAVWLTLSDPDNDSATTRFVIGLGTFLLLFLVVLFTSSPTPQQQLLLGILLGVYFCLGLSWQAIVKQEGIAQTTYGRLPARIGLAWVRVLSTISLALVAIALIIVGFQGGIAQVLGGFAGLMLRLLELVGHGLFGLLLFLASVLHLGGPSLWVGTTAVSGTLFDRVATPTVLVGALVAAVYCVLHFRSQPPGWYGAGDGERFRFPRRRPRSGGLDGAQRTSLWSWKLFRRQLRELAAAARPATARALRPVVASVPAAPAAAADPRSVRELYRAALVWCSGQGHAREAATTPLEFVPAMSELVPAQLTRRLTATYVGVRYGASAGQERLPDLLAAWRSVQAAPPVAAASPKGEPAAQAAAQRQLRRSAFMKEVEFGWDASVSENLPRARWLDRAGPSLKLALLLGLGLLIVVGVFVLAFAGHGSV